jgi:hypothetical protein
MEALKAVAVALLAVRSKGKGSSISIFPIECIAHYP